MRTIQVGLYGTNGHQILKQVSNNSVTQLAGVAAFAEPPPGARVYDSLDAMLADPNIDLISLCSPSRATQAEEAIRCMRAGKHVYGEKPSALNERDLDAILAAVEETGRCYHEMAGTLIEQPYREMRRLVLAGAIGTVVQVLAQKSYPWTDWRQRDESRDGGLSTQAGVYIARFVEHIACQKIATIQAHETLLGNPDPTSRCRIAISHLMSLENGGVASGVCNYLNPIQDRCWGYDSVRIFGTEGILESSNDGRNALLLKGRPPQELSPNEPSEDYFDYYMRFLADGVPMPLGLEEELSPTRWVIRAKQQIDAAI